MIESGEIFATRQARGMRWPLRNQIVAPFVGVLLATLVGVSFVNALVAARGAAKQIETQIGHVASTLAHSNFPLTPAVLKQTRGLSGAEFLLADADGNVVGGTLLPQPARAPASEPPAAGSLLETVVEVNGARYFHAAAPLGPRGDGSQALRLHVLFPEAGWREARWQAAFPPLALGAVALVVACALALAIAARVSRPLLQVSERVGRMLDGHFEPVVLPAPAHDDELASMVRSINVLAGQLDESRRVIKRSERLALLGQLGGGLAHHWRNDVAGARLAIELHRRHCHEADPESLDVALRQLKLAEQRLQSFLALGKPTAIHPRRLALDGLIGELAALLAPACKHLRVRLETPALDGMETWADADQLRQALLNLAWNAIEAAGPGGWARIDAAGLADGGLAIRVTDSGPGPAADMVDRLFEPFSTSKPEGIGLGLASARQIAAAHGGLLVWRRDGETCFELRLPSSTAEALAAPQLLETAL